MFQFGTWNIAQFSPYIFEYVKFKTTFEPVKNVFSKFILFSFVVMSSLGVFEGDSRKTLTVADNNGRATILVDAEQLVNYKLQPKSNRAKAKENDDEGGFVINFPNIFNVFRSLF